MKNMNNKSIKNSLRVLSILAFVMIFMPFSQAAAETLYGYGTNTGGGSNPYPNYNNGQYYNNPPYQAPIYNAPAPAPTPTVYSTSNNPVMTVNYTPKPAVAKAKTTPIKTVATTDNASALAANAIYGSNSFLPSGLIQWILFAIFILLLVLLSRIIFGGREEYHAAPMKHD